MYVASEKIQRGRGLNKHYWSQEQDNALIESLSILHIDPKWRADTGFRSGYLHEIERMMNEKLPGCGLKASPHIESRVKTLKAKFNALHDMLSLSGFGWNSESMMIECVKSVFDDYVKKRSKDAAGLYGKPFPYYYALLEIYGKDRATGAFVGSAADDEEEIRLEDLNVNSSFNDMGVDFGTNQGDDTNMGYEAENFTFSFVNTSWTSEDNGNSPEISAPKRNVKARRLDETNKTFKMMARSIADIGPKIDGFD